MVAENETSMNSTDLSQQYHGEDEELLWDAGDVSNSADDAESTDSFPDDFYKSPTVEYEPPSAISYLLGFFSPGTFLTIGNNPHYGIIVNMGLSLLSLLLCLLCIILELFPVPLFGFVMIITVAVWLYGIVSIIKRPPQVTPIMPWAQAGIAFLTFWLPFVSCFFIETNFMLQRAWMSNDNMNPGIVQGDVILVDRLAFFHKMPTYGDLVLVEEMPADNKNRRRAFFARIIACGGDEIQLRGVHPVVNGMQLTHYIHRDDNPYENYEQMVFELPYHTDDLNLSSAPPDRWYPVQMPQDLLFSQTNSVKLEQDYYYVLEDNRTSGVGHVRTSYGFIVHRSEIQGSPKYIIYNTEDDDHLSRYGLAIR
jgi:signal peptidase I